MNQKTIIGFTIGPIGAAILSFASLPIVAWFFSVQDIGRIALLQVVSNFFVILFSLGLDQAYVREYHETQEKHSLLKNAAAPSIILSLIVILGFIINGSGLLSRLLFSIDSLALSILVACCLLIAIISRFLSLILRMQEKGLAFSMSQILPKGLFLIIIVAYTILATDFSFNKLIIAHAFSIITVMLIYAWNTKKDWLPSLGNDIEIKKLRNMLQFGFPLIFGGLASWALMAMDKLFLRSMSTFEELGIYSVAASVAAAAGIFSGIFNTIWAPTIYKWTAKEINLDKIDRISEHVLAATFFVFSVFGMFAWVLQYLLPSTYNSVQYLVTACIAVPLLYTLSETTAVGIGLARKTSYLMIASFIAAAVNFGGNYWLVPKYGAAGAASSTAFSFWIFLVCRTEFSCHVWRNMPRLKLYVSTFACLLVAITSSIIGKDNKTITISSWVALGLIGIWVFKNSLRAAKVELLLTKDYYTRIRN